MRATTHIPQIPRLGLGTWQLSGETCRRVVEQALELGYRHLDTAQGYENEREVGDALAASGVPRSEVLLTTKLGLDALAPEVLPAAVAASLDRLRTDFVDLLLVHWPSREVPLEDTLFAMQAECRAGRVRALGVSNFPLSWVDRALEIAPIVCDQVEYHPFLDQERLRRGLIARGVALVAYSPLACGATARDPVIREVAASCGRSPAQVVLAWLLAQEGVAAIPRSARLEHLRDNLEALSLRLPADVARRIASRARGERLFDPPFAPDWDRPRAEPRS